MSRRETPMTRWYWKQVGGTLIEEFCVVERILGGSVSGSVLGSEFTIDRSFPSGQ